MSRDRSVLVVDEDDPSGMADHISDRGFAVETSTSVAGASVGADYECVVCGRVHTHTVTELLSQLDASARAVVYVYDDQVSATTALDAGATTTIRRGDPDSSAWGGHLAATVENAVRRIDRPGGRLLSRALDEIQDLFFLVSVDGRFLRWNDRFSEVSGYDDAEIVEMAPTDFFEGDDVDRIENAIGRVVVNGEATVEADLVTTGGEAIPHEFTGSLIEVDGEQAIVGTARDVRDRLYRETELERQTAQLKTAYRVNALIRDVMAVLLSAGTREGLTEGVCERLVGDDAYRFAWLGSYDAETGHVEPDAWAGDGEGYLDERPVGGTGEPDGSVTALTAVREERVVFAGDVASDAAAGSWRTAALEYGHRSAVAIPVVYGNATYGCLCLYADESDAFGPLEREVLAEFGEIIGHAIRAVEARRALATDTVTEVQFRITDADSFLVRASEHAEAELELVGSAGRPDGAVVQLFEVSGVPPSTVERLVEMAPLEAEILTERDDECVISVTLQDHSIAHVLAEIGGSVRTIEVGGDARMSVEVPRTADPGEVLDRIRGVSDIEFLSRREVQRNDWTDVDFRADVERHLTKRQLDVLETAYGAGFFEWPREQTGEEVAAVLDVAPPTFHQHLRLGEKRLLEVLFERASSNIRTEAATPDRERAETTGADGDHEPDDADGSNAEGP